MKRCPTCQKEFPDSMRFCQTDGTSLVEVAEKPIAAPPAPPPPPPDPYKTVVGGSIKMDDDLLQLPEQDDPNKTMISPISAPKPPPVSSEPPKTGDPGLSPPSFGDLSPKPSDDISSGGGSIQPPRFDAPPPPPLPKSDPLPPPSSPPPFGASPFSNEPSGGSDSPFDKPGSSPFDKPGGASPFDKPAAGAPAPPPSPFEKTPPPPYKEPESPQFGQSPFGGSSGSQQNEPFNQPFQQNDWTPPPAPVAGWQDQGLGADTPFQPPPAGGGGQNNTLAIVSLVCGILSICLCGVLTGLPALITGYMAKNNADSNPAVYGGRGMALAGMITGAVGTLFGILTIIYWVVILSSGGRF